MGTRFKAPEHESMYSLDNRESILAFVRRFPCYKANPGGCVARDLVKGQGRGRRSFQSPRADAAGQKVAYVGASSRKRDLVAAQRMEITEASAVRRDVGVLSLRRSEKQTTREVANARASLPPDLLAPGPQPSSILLMAPWLLPASSAFLNSTFTRVSQQRRAALGCFWSRPASTAASCIWGRGEKLWLLGIRHGIEVLFLRDMVRRGLRRILFLG